MGRDTKIQWCDHTAQLWEGCEKKDPGCKNCYAETLEKKFGHKDIWGKLKPRKWTKGGPKLIRKLNKECEKAGRRDIVFINDLSDFFEDHTGLVIDHKKVPVNFCVSCGHIAAFAPFGLVPDHAQSCCQYPAYQNLDVKELRKSAFKLFDECQHLIFLLLTKRPENIRRMWPTEDDGHGGSLAAELFAEGRPGKLVRRRDNVGLGTSISDQATADKAIPELLKCRELTPLLFVSYEPALGPVDLQRSITKACVQRCEYSERGKIRIVQDSTEGGMWVECQCSRMGKIDWLIIGGESGDGARAFDLNWAEATIEQCRAANVPVFLKQCGRCPLWREKDRAVCGVRAPLLDRKGGDINEWPPELRVREWPELLRRRDEASVTQDDKTSVNVGDVPTRA